MYKKGFLMWSDNETTKDFLNYEIHCNLIKEYVTNSKLLPITIGVFGDWGSGKSSIMKILEQKVKQDDKVLTIYFNSWLFESYENAKVSLLESILLELSKNTKLEEKAKKKVLQLLSRIDYMKLVTDGAKKYGKNIIDIVATGGIATTIEAGYSMIKDDVVLELEKDDSKLFDKYIKDEQRNNTKNSIKSFKKDFEELIQLTNYDSVVIFVDDLDRCLPERVIDTLEAIKLFLSVNNTAFIIGADERIIRHSIAMHLKLHTINNKSDFFMDTEQIITDYIEKLIQVPYRIPKLSLAEVETYNNLLFCQMELNGDLFNNVYEKYIEFRSKDFYSAFTYGHIKEIINIKSNIKLNSLLNLSHTMSQMITTVLKGNPRQTKRFLNTFILRSKLAEVANIEIEQMVLVKLMLLEYFDTKLFKKLNSYQAQNDGKCNEINQLEEYILNNSSEIGDELNEWQTPQVVNWLKIEPKLSNIDLRNYFWLVRDKTESTLSDVHLVSPILQKLYKGLTSSDESVRRVNIYEAKKLDSIGKKEIFKLFETSIQLSKKPKNLLEYLHKLSIEINKKEFYSYYLQVLSSIPYERVQYYMQIIEWLKEFLKNDISLTNKVEEIIEYYSNEKGNNYLKKAAIKYFENKGK
jgi:predicted KAP-like P-loop ATPase